MTASLVAEPAGDGTRLTVLRSSPPISFRDTADGVYLVASGAGPIGGDAHVIDLTIAEGATVTVRAAAASMVLPGPRGATSSLVVRADVAGTLSWLPEPAVLVRGCDHRAAVQLCLTAGAVVAWREEVVLGRHHEPSGSLLQRLRVDRDGRPLLRIETPFGPRWPASDGPAGTAGAGATGSLLLVGTARPHVEDERAAVLELDDDAWLVSVLAADATGVRRALLNAYATAWSGSPDTGASMSSSGTPSSAR